MNALLATHGRPEMLHDTLASLLDPENRSLLRKVVVVENGGDFGVGEVVGAFSAEDAERLELVTIPEANKSLALNAGLEFCDDGLIFLTDDDVVIPPATIRRYSEAARKHGPGNYFGGPTTPVYEATPEPWLKAFLPASATGWPRGPLGDGEAWDCMGFNWAAYKSDLLEAGGFNPDFGPGSMSGATGQESEMQRKLRARGIMPCFVDGALVEHLVPASRCSIEWAIRRARRYGLERGIIAAEKDLGDALKDARRRRWRGRIRRLIAACSADPQRRFRSEYWDSADTGFGEGVERVRRRPA